MLSTVRLLIIRAARRKPVISARIRKGHPDTLSKIYNRDNRCRIPRVKRQKIILPIPAARRSRGNLLCN